MTFDTKYNVRQRVYYRKDETVFGRGITIVPCTITEVTFRSDGLIYHVGIFKKGESGTNDHWFARENELFVSDFCWIWDKKEL